MLVPVPVFTILAAGPAALLGPMATAQVTSIKSVAASTLRVSPLSLGLFDARSTEVVPNSDGRASEAGEPPWPEQDLGDQGGGEDGFRYTRDLTDEELARRWLEEPETLGSMSVGLVEAGRVINGVQVPEGPEWKRVSPEFAWATQETVDALVTAARAVRARFPAAPPLRINHIGKQEGGFLRGHHSHQSGRDADLGFYCAQGAAACAAHDQRAAALDLPQNWALVRALITESDVQVILVDRRVQTALYRYALSIGEDRAWLDRLFHGGRASLFQHVRRHRDHFHVRFYGGRSQELGYRVHSLLAQRPEQNVAVHRVSPGDTLGRIAHRYGSTVTLIQRANALSGTALRVGRTLRVPLRGPCTKCPRPSLVEVPPRLLPPPTLET